MKVLLVCKRNSGFTNNIAVFNRHLVESLKKRKIDIDIFTIEKGGLFGYFMASLRLSKILKKNKYDILHAIYGLAGLTLLINKRIPKIITYIGSDINIRWVCKVSKLFLFKRASTNIFVSDNLYQKAGKPKNSIIIPFGVDFSKFNEVNKDLAKEKIGLDRLKLYILFPSRFDRQVKNVSLAKKAISIINNPNIILIELKNIPDDLINYYYNASDLLLMTSFSEGSPQSVKEALACNTPIVSVNVGDIKDNIFDVKGCFITSYDPYDIAEKVKSALDFSKNVGKTESRKRIEDKKLGIESVAQKVIDVYYRTLQ